MAEHDIDVVTPDTITDAQISDVVISYAWDNRIGDKILAQPDSKLKWIQTQSAGVDYLPLQTLKERGIIVTNASGLKSRTDCANGVELYFIFCPWLKCVRDPTALGTVYRSVYGQ